MGFLDFFKRKTIYVPILVREAHPEITFGFDLRPLGENTSKLKDTEEIK